MNEKDMLKQMEINDLPEPYDEYAEYLGIDALYELCSNFGGGNLYVPTTKMILQKWKYTKIRQEYNGYNSKELSRKYKVSSSTVYRLCKDIK